MKTLFFFLLGVLLVITVSGKDECSFTVDCASVPRCVGIQDASCVCRFGSCVISGNPFFRGKECEDYTDCSCSDTPDTCFCRNGFCSAASKDKWECHTARDCKKISKCSDKECNCSDNLCEFECSTVADCLQNKSFCSTIEGYKCKCEESLCGLEKLASECDEISDCVKIGKCTADQPCACTNNVCVDPWFISSKWRSQYPTKNCRDQTDCNYAIAQCQTNRCSCENLVQVDEYEKWGECTLTN